MSKSTIKKEDISWVRAQSVKSNAYKIVIPIPKKKYLVSIHLTIKKMTLFSQLILVVKE